MSTAPMTVKTSVALDYSKRFADSPTRTVARALHACETALFPSVENARKMVSRLRGTTVGFGQIARDDRGKGWKSPKLVMPESRDNPLMPLDLTRDGKFLVLCDIHLPYHDKTALEAALRFGKKNKCDHVIYLGDYWDAYGISRHSPDPRERDVKREIDTVKEFFGYVKQLFPKAPQWAKTGNHEARLEKYLNQNAPVLLGIPEFSLEALLRFDDFGIEIVESTQLIKLGGLTALHGHEIPGGATSPVSPAKGLCDRIGVSAMCGHHHFRSQHTATLGVPGDRRTVYTYSVACLTGLFPSYSPINRWGHGVAIVDTLSNGEFHVNNYSIIDGKVF